VRLTATVVKGFGRGATQLGFPTANLEKEQIADIIEDVPRGVYFGWAMVGNAGPFRAVSSVGINPVFELEETVVEPHLLHKFDSDFYGQEMRLLLCGYLRPEWNFPSLETLIAAIENDCRIASDALDDKEGVFAAFAKDGMLTAAL
jgi:FAD synthase